MACTVNFCNFCWYGEKDRFTVTKIDKNTKITIGNDRIYRLKTKESFKEYTKSFPKITPSANKNSETSINIFELKNPYICIFCGGEDCKYENVSNYSQTALPGIITDLFLDCIYASQRPSTLLIKKYKLIDVLKFNNIKLIVNCEIHGEHPYCGPINGLENDGGFSYSPSVFIANGIDVLCCGFPDMTPPKSYEFMLNIVKKISYVIKYKKSKVLVHCHAGNGRTGLVIACFFIFYFGKSAMEAIKEVRTKRKKGLEVEKQENFCKNFENFVKYLKNMYPGKKTKIEFYVKNQNILDFDDNSKINLIPSLILSYYFRNKNIDDYKDCYNEIIDIKYIPRMIFECIEKIIELKYINNTDNISLYEILSGLNKLSDPEINQINIIQKELKFNKYDSIQKSDNISVVSEIFFKWLNECVLEIISSQKLENILKKIYTVYNNNKKEMDINFLFQEIIDNNNINKDIIDKLIFIIEDGLNKIEYNFIKYISLFLEIIYPNPKISGELIEYKRFLYKLCLFLLGYNLDKFNLHSKKHNVNKELNQVKILIFIFELFIFYYKEQKNEINIPDKNSENNEKRLDIFFRFKDKIDFCSVKSLFLQ